MSPRARDWVLVALTAALVLPVMALRPPTASSRSTSCGRTAPRTRKRYVANGTGNLRDLSFHDAFWANITAPGTYVVSGLVNGTPEVDLVAGWNLVAYASFANRTREESLAGVAGILAVETFDPSPANPYHLRAVPGSESLVPGHGYWVWIAGGGGGLWRQS